MTSREIEMRQQASGGAAGQEPDEAGRPDQRDGGPGQPERNGSAPGERLLTPEIVTLAAVVVLGSIMTILDATVVNVALPTLGREFRTSISVIQWVPTVYLLAFASVIPLTGWASERFGARRVWLVSLAAFMLGSLLCGLAGSVAGLIEFQPGLAACVAGLALVASFGIHALRTPQPLIDVRLFARRGFTAAALTNLVLGMALFGVALLLPLYFEIVRGRTPLETGLLLIPQGLGAALAMPVAGSLTDRIGARPVVVTGVGLALAGTPPTPRSRRSRRMRTWPPRCSRSAPGSGRPSRRRWRRPSSRSAGRASRRPPAPSAPSSAWPARWARRCSRSRSSGP